MQPEVQKYLRDMQQAGENILEYTAGLSVDQYNSNDLVSSAVEWNFIIIGEALMQASELDPDIQTQIADSSKFIHMHDHLIEEYDSIDDNALFVWAREMLPILIQNLHALLNSG